MYIDAEVEMKNPVLLHTIDVERAVSQQKSLKQQLASEKRPLGRLAYLDGLRGFSALLVYILHYQVLTHPGPDRDLLENAYGYDGKYCFAALPFLRLFFTGGHHGVLTFFVISGYVLSNSPLRLIHSRDAVKFLDTVSSALVRRFFRLYIPVAATTLIFLLFWHVLDIRTVHESQKTLIEELRMWWRVSKNSSFLYTTAFWNSYNFHLWSIPIEFRGSVIIYTVLVALQRSDKNKRVLCQAVLIWYFTYVVDGWYCALFVSGMLLCDLDLLTEAGESPNVLNRFRSLPSWFYTVLLLISVYVGNVPCASEGVEYLQRNPGWYWLSYLKPGAMGDGRWFYRGLGAILTVVAVPRIAILKSFFESDISQYLGKISYGFYLVHGPILYLLGDRLYAASGRSLEYHARVVPGWINLLPLPSWGPVGLEINHLAPQLVLFPFTIWVADLATRVIDEPSVRLSRQLQRWLSEAA